MKRFFFSELSEFAVILKTDNKDAMLGRFKKWYRNMLYEYCRREQICNILVGHFGSVDAEWDNIEIQAEQNYRQDTKDALTDIYERRRCECFERLYRRYRIRCAILKKMKKNSPWYAFVKVWKAKYRLRQADKCLTLRDVLQVAGCTYMQKGGQMSGFKTAMMNA